MVGDNARELLQTARISIEIRAETTGLHNLHHLVRPRHRSWLARSSARNSAKDSAKSFDVDLTL